MTKRQLTATAKLISAIDPATLAKLLAIASGAPKSAKAPANRAQRRNSALRNGGKSKSERMELFAQKVITAFKAAGYDDVTPRVDVLTYKRWLEKGRKVRQGEKSVRVDGVPLFHLNQTEAVAAN